MQSVAGARAHCTLVMPGLSSTNCGGPPDRGTRISRAEASDDLQIGKISTPTMLDAPPANLLNLSTAGSEDGRMVG
jgi:hypothetical protein